MARYGKSAQRSVKRAMHKLKEGSLRSGKSGKRVKSKKQAIAIGLSEARARGQNCLQSKFLLLRELVRHKLFKV